MTETIVAQIVDVLEEAIPYEETEDPSKKAHIINPAKNIHIWQPGMTAQDVVDVARATGMFVMSLCEVMFIPKHDPSPLPACERCIEIAGMIISEDG